MDENRVGGAAGRLAGKVQGAAGDLIGDAKTQVEGAAREAGGRAREAHGETKDMVRSAAAHVQRGVEQQPVVALLVAAAVGYALGLLTARR